MNCAYCFADGFKKEEPFEVTPEEFFYMMMEFKRLTGPDKSKSLGLIGGEPTLHTQFKDLLRIYNRYLDSADIQGLIYTNGIEVYRFVEDFSDHNVLSINCNNPKEFTGDNYDKFVISLDKLAYYGYFEEKVATLGINIFDPDIHYYDYVIDLIEKYHIKELRVALCAPCNRLAHHRHDKFGYFDSLKSPFLYICEIAVKYNVKVTCACTYFPECFFNDEEKNLILKAMQENVYMRQTCFTLPAKLIDRNLNITLCFAIDKKYRAKDFDNYVQLQNAATYEAMKLLDKNTSCDRCSSCRSRELVKCQGGCLAFADK